MSYTTRTNEFFTALAAVHPVIPVITLGDVTIARDLATALCAGGASALEITLRTEAATKVIEEMSTVGNAVVGAGTIIHDDDIRRSKDAGARFGVSPGITPRLLELAEKEDFPLLPGVATASEAMLALRHGWTVAKLFPAVAAGGITTLNAMSGPFPTLRFCPTGGITPESAPSFLALSNVMCVGGSWLTPAAALTQRNWKTIESLAKQAATLRHKNPSR